MIRAAIVGLGRWGQTLVASVQGKSHRIRFTTAVSRNPARAAEFVARYELRVASSFEAMLADPAIDAVVLATPHSQHVDAVVAAAAAGKAVLCEKPLALTRAEAERARIACERAGVVLGVGTDKRFFPAMQEAARLAASGELGPLLHIEGHFSNETYFVSDWRDKVSESPGGGMTSTGIHALDSMVRIGGPVKRVQAVMLSHQQPPEPLDSIAAVLEFRSGMTGVLAAVRTTPLFWRVHVFGRDGSAEALGRTELVLRRRGAKAQRLKLSELSATDSVRANLEAFANAVAGNARYPISPAEIVDVVAAFEAIVASAGARGRAVDV